ncbi:MAG: S41 family peptidase, partial [Clostridia bacterium]|nr:S41 family peptidase [Clostridia bacterium]
RYGYRLAMQLALGHIPIYWLDGKGYMPVTTFADLFLSGLGLSMIYNGQALFLTYKNGFDDTVPDENGKTLKDIVFETSVERTRELAEFTYWEMVMMFDGNYGLRDEHQIGDDFDMYLKTIGLKDRLLSQDGAEFSDALVELLLGYFGDLHSALSQGSPFAGSDYAVDFNSNGNLSSSYTSMISNMTRYGTWRAKSSSVGIDGKAFPYLEVGNTAYITFDTFAMNSTQNYYDPEVRQTLASTAASDNVALIHYANERINREGSPVENIVIDLSLNGGGMADAAYFVISWVLGVCNFSTVNPLSMAQYTVGYKADVNLDGYITDEDHIDLSKFKVYCLTSECSFSCGNLAPSAFKDSGIITLLGRKTGGGACVVDPIIAADGTVYQYSSRYRLSTVKNGSYYSIDQGIEPDFVISNPEHMYDRAWLTDYINQLP